MAEFGHGVVVSVSVCKKMKGMMFGEKGCFEIDPWGGMFCLREKNQTYDARRKVSDFGIEKIWI